ncbi:MAG: hypothetical protein R2764_09185 [Bacteroidales bacterium]
MENFFQPTSYSHYLIGHCVGNQPAALYYHGDIMSHAYSFALISIFIYYTIKWHETPNIKYTLIAGALAGLITLIRPTNILVLVFFILWNVGSFKDLGNRMVFFLKYYKLIVVMMLAFLVVWVPQFIYWKFISGSFMFNTYGYLGGTFFFDNPQITYSLFSWRKGWLVYTPIMIFTLAGIYFLRKRTPKVFAPVLVFTLLNIYVLSSWWCWWFGGGFGLRSYIDSYGIMALGFAAILDWVINRKAIVKYSFITIFVLLFFFNLFQTQQYFTGAIHYVAMTKEAYWNTFLKKYPKPDFYDLLVWPDYPSARHGKYYTENEISIGEQKIRDGLKIESEQPENSKSIEEFEIMLRNSPSLLELLHEKAVKKGISIDSMIKIDALWLYNQQMKELEGKQ